MIQQFVWIASLLAAAGAMMDALDLRASQYRFVLYLAANILSLAYACTLHSASLLWLFSVMLLSSIIGVWRWIRSRMHSRGPAVRLYGLGSTESMLSRLFRRRWLRGSGWSRNRVRVIG
jgi:uncharacterized membrane protein YoaK (UPF0700 family)